MQTVTSRDGTTIAYDQAGKGPALILVAGAFSYRKYPMLPKLMAALSDHFTVYNYDRRGRGDSTDTQPYSIQREIEDLRALVRAAGGEAYVWGQSSGAALALHAAAADIGIRSLALYQPPFRVDTSKPLPPTDFPQHLGMLVAEGNRSAAVRYMMTKGMGAPGIAVGIMRLLPLWKRLTRVAHTLPYDVTIVGDRIYGKPLTPADFADVKVPTLVMAGGKAPELLRTGAEQLAAVLPDGTYQVLDGQSHAVSPASLKPALTTFFQQ
ncbi:alpha/beta hydrolase [Kribbella sp. NBC_01484]|uniref:alpha/beta fold hydrolase n=1 Tax=Kribbella sp. NBC_01484 TaxID=2903579 RepID=UPI002E2ED84F|nr:alpha/beta hydrolase [Kribbella sp. NBC_01484]